MKYLLILVFLYTGNYFFAQQNSKKYQYIFSGTLLPETKSAIEQHLLRNNEVTEAKIKYKPEKEMGELIFIVSPQPNSGEAYKAFSLSEVKKLFQQYNLSPIEIKEIETTN
ncbi:MAG: hypothetical protein ACK5QC_09685 [Bacteroidota bacterium]|jgi:hypothetical protein|nr:hypothetical protein [Bacteroidota bacterium]MCA6444481.1 hypothetical protein [Bacteroidota bacterium]